MGNNYPVIWVIGATRSCKTAVARNGIAPLGFEPVSTGDFFREQYGQPDTICRQFVFDLSAFSAGILTQNPDCHLANLTDLFKKSSMPRVIEGERNPVEFAKLYNPKTDMVIFLNRLDVDIYDTAIEKGLDTIEKIVRWNIGVGITPEKSVMKLTFGLDSIKAERFDKNGAADSIFLEGSVKPKAESAADEDRYPWINILIGAVRHEIQEYYDFQGKFAGFSAEQNLTI